MLSSPGRQAARRPVKYASNSAVDFRSMSGGTSGPPSCPPTLSVLTPRASPRRAASPYEEFNLAPRWAFGHGGSYTGFRYSGLRVPRGAQTPGTGDANVSFTLTNTEPLS